MRTLPGAPVPPGDVVGRDEFIDALWDTLLRQSVRLIAERRIGKTSIIRKMHAEARDGFLTYFRDLEFVTSTAEFADIVFQDVEGQLSLIRKGAAKTRTFLSSLGGAEFQGVKLPDIAARHWKNILTHAIEDLLDNTDKIVVFFWDELPWMVKAIAKNEGEKAAMELLDLLRALRQTYPYRLRMVFTGSIGLHHVISELREENYNNSPVNDMPPREVTPLSPADGQELARLLLQGESINAAPLDDVAEAIATEVDNIAFYIQHVVDRIKMSGASAPVTAQMARDTVAQALTDPNDAWDLMHFQARVRTYYGSRDKLALLLLDEVAIQGPIAFATLHNAVQVPVAVGAEEVRDLLRLLGHDHYLIRRPDGTYEFRYGLIRRWWRLERGL